MNKKSVELTFNTIVIIALALLVLVVLSIIFMNRAGVFNKSINPTCEERGGTCIGNNENCPPDKMTIYAKCGNKIQKCCVSQVI